MHAAPIKPNHKAIQKYHDALAEYHAGQVEHEGALRTAFGNLLADTCKAQHWLLIPEEPTKVGGKTVRPDGTLRDLYNLHRGFWEAKDTGDNLSVEVKTIQWMAIGHVVRRSSIPRRASCCSATQPASCEQS